MYVRVWEYDVDAGLSAAFVAAYGADGDWARLFREARGFEGTELYRNDADGTRYVTIDQWASTAAWTAFLERYRQAYEALDARLAGLSRGQRELVAGTGPGA